MSLAFAAAINASRWRNCSDSSGESETIVTSKGNAPLATLFSVAASGAKSRRRTELQRLRYEFGYESGFVQVGRAGKLVQVVPRNRVSQMIGINLVHCSPPSRWLRSASTSAAPAEQSPPHSALWPGFVCLLDLFEQMGLPYPPLSHCTVL